MPPLIPIIIGIAIAAPAIGAVAAGAAFAGLAGSLILLGSSLILSGVSRALVKTPSLGDFETKAASRLVNARQSSAPSVIPYGLSRLGGIVTFLDKRGTNGELLDVVITLARREVEEIGNMYFDDVLVPLDASGVGSVANATGTFAGFVRVQKNLGADSQAALSDLVTANSQWTSNHRQRGCAHVWVELKFNSDLFPSGVPEINFDVKGAKVFDTRTSTTAYSANAALCLRDYLVTTRLKGGAGIAASLIPDSFVDAAANLADEDVTLDLGGTEDRYTCNGTVSTAELPGRIIQQMLSAMAGKLVFSGGEWQMYGGAWRAPTVSFDEDDLVGRLKVESRLPRRELFNAVKGVIVTAANKWQPSDFPPVTNSTYETEDGERLWKDVDFPFTTSAATAQRLGKLDLETARLQKTVRVRMNLKALQVNPPDVIQLTVARFSWTNKSFEIAEQQLVWDDAGDAPALVVEMLLRETASTVYDWTAASDEDQPTTPETPTLPDPSVVAAPTGLSLATVAVTRADGVRVTFLHPTWTAPADEFVTEGGQIQIQYKKNSSGTWLPFGSMPGNETEAFIPNVDDSTAYDLRIRSVNFFLARSAWVQQLNFTVTAPTSTYGAGASFHLRGVFIPDQIVGSPNTGEIDFDPIVPGGDYFIVHPDGSFIEVTNANRSRMSQACLESDAGRRYIIFSKTLCNSARGLSADRDSHILVVRREAGVWEYDNDAGWSSFTPVDTDIIIFEVERSGSGWTGKPRKFIGLELTAHVQNITNLENLGPANGSYRPLSNPLTATDAGATATIEVANFTMRIAGLSDLSVTGNSTDLTGKAFDTVHYVFYDDPTIAGGAVTFGSSTTREDALSGGGRFFIGTIRTPADGGADTVGLGDGGAAAQISATGMTVRPTENVTSGSFGFTNPDNAQDGVLASFARGFDADTDNQPKQTKWFAFQVPNLGIGIQEITLKIDWETIKVGAGVVVMRLRYSKDGGISWVTEFSTNLTRARETRSISLGGLDISQLQADALSDWATGGSTSGEVKVYDMWVEVVNLGA